MRRAMRPSRVTPLRLALTRTGTVTTCRIGGLVNGGFGEGSPAPAPSPPAARCARARRALLGPAQARRRAGAVRPLDRGWMRESETAPASIAVCLPLLRWIKRVRMGERQGEGGGLDLAKVGAVDPLLAVGLVADAGKAGRMLET